MSFGLPEKLIHTFNEIFASYSEIEKVIIYGSRAKGNFRNGSDIDLTLVGENITEDIKSKVWLDLDELNSPYLIDISVLHSLKSESLLEHIQRIGKDFYIRNSR